MGLQSRLAGLSSVQVWGVVLRDLRARALRRQAPPCALSAGRALRPVSRRLDAFEEGRFGLRAELL